MGADRAIPAGFKLSDLAPWHLVSVTCIRCGHRRRLDHRALRRRWPPTTTLLELRGRLRCTDCGRRGGHTLTIALMPRE